RVPDGLPCDEKHIAVEDLGEYWPGTFDFHLYRNVAFAAHAVREILERATQSLRKRIVTQVRERLPGLIEREPKLDARAVEEFRHGRVFGFRKAGCGFEQSGGAHAALNHGIVHVAGDSRAFGETHGVTHILLVLVVPESKPKRSAQRKRHEGEEPPRPVKMRSPDHGDRRPRNLSR